TSTPAGRELVEGATRLDDDLHALKALPYRVTTVAGDGWATVGDASGFIDPFYSPGLDWAALTITKTVGLIGRNASTAVIDKHNRDFRIGFARWFDALYRDKYYSMGD